MSRVAPVAARVVAIDKTCFPDLGPRAYCLTIDGDGLRPRFCSGDVVVIDPDRIPKQGDMVVLYGDGRIAEFAGELERNPVRFEHNQSWRRSWRIRAAGRD